MNRTTERLSPNDTHFIATMKEAIEELERLNQAEADRIIVNPKTLTALRKVAKATDPENEHFDHGSIIYPNDPKYDTLWLWGLKFHPDDSIEEDSFLILTKGQTFKGGK